MRNKYSGMTVNERLYISGKMDEFDQAVEKKEVEKIIAILEELEIDEASIKSILNEYGLKS